MNLSIERMKDHERYWLSAFSGELPELNLPTDFPVRRFKVLKDNPSVSERA